MSRITGWKNEYSSRRCVGSVIPVASNTSAPYRTPSPGSRTISMPALPSCPVSVFSSLLSGAAPRSAGPSSGGWPGR